MTPTAAVAAAQVKWRAVSTLARKDDYHDFDAVLQIVTTTTKTPHAALLNAVAQRYKKSDTTITATLASGTTIGRLPWNKKMTFLNSWNHCVMPCLICHQKLQV